MKVRSVGRSQAGFTLIEMLIVVLLVGVLAAVAAPVYFGYVKNAKLLLEASHSPALNATANHLIQLGNRIVGQSNPDSTQAIAWRVVTGAVSSDPATGGLDRGALQALNQNLLERDAEIVTVMGEVDALLGGNLPEKERILLLDASQALALTLDWVRKLEAVVQPLVSVSAP